MNSVRWLLAVGLATLTGCHACLLDRCDQRPFLNGSFSHKRDYDDVASRLRYRPWYHFGSPDGWLDRKLTRHAAIRTANDLLESCYGYNVSQDFRDGFQQAFIDIANGGAGTVPTVPPPKYWSAAYRTPWGHERASEWFDGYDAGGNAACQGVLNDSRSVASSATFEDEADDRHHGQSMPMSPHPNPDDGHSPSVPATISSPTPAPMMPRPSVPSAAVPQSTSSIQAMSAQRFVNNPSPSLTPTSIPRSIPIMNSGMNPYPNTYRSSASQAMPQWNSPNHPVPSAGPSASASSPAPLGNNASLVPAGAPSMNGNSPFASYLPPVTPTNSAGPWNAFANTRSAGSSMPRGYPVQPMSHTTSGIRPQGAFR